MRIKLSCSFLQYSIKMFRGITPAGAKKGGKKRWINWNAQRQWNTETSVCQLLDCECNHHRVTLMKDLHKLTLRGEMYDPRRPQILWESSIVPSQFPNNFKTWNKYDTFRTIHQLKGLSYTTDIDIKSINQSITWIKLMQFPEIITINKWNCRK